MLRLHDTATGRVAPLDLRDRGRVSMYVCGPTVYDEPHLGHGRFALVFDVLRRYLIFEGFEVTYVSNVTDVDDHIIERARERGVSEGDLATTYERVWWESMDGLGVLRPDADPHATAYVDRMVEFVSGLVEKGVAYSTDDGVYLSVEAVPGYGLLAHQPLESLRAGARVEVDKAKRSPLDFALWKRAKAGEPTWPSPFGDGRPGWHTECVVMSLDLLGDGFDLHGAGIDLAFPHHENERAQAVAAGRRFARHWVHNGHVTVGGEKMSKSLGNFTSLGDLLSRGDPRAFRLLVLQAHYRKPIEVTPETIAQASSGLERLDEMARRVGMPVDDAAGTVPPAVRPPEDGESGRLDSATMDHAAVARFRQRMDDDLDTPGAMAEVFELVREANSAADAGDAARAARSAETARSLCAAVGLRIGRRTDDVDQRTAELVRRRDEARAQGDWDRADSIRDELHAAGWVVEDGPRGTQVRRR